MPTDVQSLTNEAKCLLCYGSLSLEEGIELALLARIQTSGLSSATQYLVTTPTNTFTSGGSIVVTAQLADVHGVAVKKSGVVVTWTNTGASGSYATGTSVTDINGQATNTFTNNLALVNYTFTATDTSARTGTSAVVQSLLQAKVTNWQTRVVANGGSAPTTLELQSVDTYYRGCVTDGIDSLILTDLPVISSSLIGAITPFFNVIGNDPWTNHGPFVIGDLTINGLTGDGVGKYLDLGFVPATAPPLSSTNAGLVSYQFIVGNGNYVFGDAGVANSSHWAMLSSAATINYYCWRFVNQGQDYLASANPHGTQGFKGFQSGQRTGASTGASYFQNSTTGGLVTLGSFAGAQTGAAITVQNLYAFGLNNNGTPGGFVTATVSYLAVTQGMNATQVASHYTRVNQLRIDLGGGFI